jgi:hypothetical protein
MVSGKCREELTKTKELNKMKPSMRETTRSKHLQHNPLQT